MELNQQIQLLSQIILAGALGGLIGLERKAAAHRSAGIRTHIFISSVAAIVVVVSRILIDSYQYLVPVGALRVDPTNLVQGLIVGICFIGGGIIIKNKDDQHVVNLTTAASLLVASTIGICVALSQWFLAVGITFFILIVNFVLLRIEKKVEEEGEILREESVTRKRQNDTLN